MDKICPRDVSRVLVRDVARTIAEYLVNGAGVMFHDIIYIYIYSIMLEGIISYIVAK